MVCKSRRISSCRLSPPNSDVCQPEPGNAFCDVMTFVSLWLITFHDRMKLECSLQRIPRVVFLGLLELNFDWSKFPKSQKSFPGSGSQTDTSDSRKYVCVRRLQDRVQFEVFDPYIGYHFLPCWHLASCSRCNPYI